MKSSAFLSWTGSLLLLGATTLPGADQTGLTSAPAVRDLSQPAAATNTAPATVSPQIPELPLTAQFDRNGDQRLDAAERRAARVYLAEHPLVVPPPPAGRPGQSPQPEAPLEPVKAGEKVGPDSVALFSDKSLYDPRVLRTLFLEFEDADWEKELADFARTDVLVPARMRLDGKTYAGVGLRFHDRAAAATFTPGYKRSLDLKLDYTAGQSIGNQRSLQLRDARTDPTFLRTMLYHRVAREYGPAPQANLVRVVINGEDWGVYVSVQPLDENLTQEYFGTAEGTRWTAGPGANFAYLGDNPEAYKNLYHLQSKEDPAAWTALVQLCKTLSQTPLSELRPALEPRLDLDSTLMFFALENTLMNQDGYGSSTGSFGLYLDARGRFHLIAQDAEASFRLRQVSEYGDRRSEPKENRAPKDGKEPVSPDAVPKGYDKKDFPRQAGTNLAMLLSYSFINKADTDLDGKVTKAEWLTFARVWFMVMDEDYAGQLSRQQFIDKVRLVVTPTSIADGRTKQTFGRDDPAGEIGQDFFAAMDTNHDGQLTQEELTAAFGRWFADWSDAKTGLLTQDRLQRGFTALFTKSVFQADQAFIAKHNDLAPEKDEPDGKRGGRGGNGIGLGPLRMLGLGGGGGEKNDRTLVVFHEQLDPLAALDDPAQPLLAKLLAVPALRTKYLDFMRDITGNWLTWAKLGPDAKQAHDLIAAEVAKETHKASSYEKFVQELDQDTTGGARDGDQAPSLRNFITERNSYLLKGELLSGGN